jgi:hypothetical protein
VTVSDPASHQIDHKVGEAVVTGVFNLGDGLQLVGDGLQNAAFAQCMLDEDTLSGNNDGYACEALPP